MGATVITLVLLMVIFPIIEGVLAMSDNPYWYLLSAGGDSIAFVYGGMELFMEGLFISMKNITVIMIVIGLFILRIPGVGMLGG